LLFDPIVGPIVAASLSLASIDSLCLQGAEALIVDWGLVPSDVAGNPDARRRHVADTLACMPFVSDVLIAGDGSAPEPVPAPENAFSVPPRIVGMRKSLRAPLVACAIACGALLTTFIPGLLAFPIIGERVQDFDSSLKEGWLRGLEARKARLEAALGLECPALKAQETSLLPILASNLRVAPPEQSAPSTALPPAASPGPAAAAPMNMAERLDRGVVMVIAGDKLGSGFFIAPDLIVTNRHVVGGLRRVRIIGKRFGMLAGEVAAEGGDSQLSDFALLHVPPQSSAQPFVLAAPARALEPVISAGFPGLYMSTDPIFLRLKQGDESVVANLEPVLQSGIINHLQHYDAEAVTLVLHSAEIAPGNSGGPLVDGCGRVVGVNTFYRTERGQPNKARYALGADGLSAFLHGAGVEMQPKPEACAPVIVDALSNPTTQNGSAAPVADRQANQPR
jgi:hypothetical protein